MDRLLSAVFSLSVLAQQGQNESTPFEVIRGRNVCGEDELTEAPLEPCFTILEWTGSRLAATVGGAVIPPALRIILILALAFGLSWFLRRAIHRFTRGLKQKALDKITTRQADPNGGGTRVSARTDTIGGVLRSVATVTVWGIALLLILGELGVDLAPLLAGAGVAGLALGFGAQRLVQDFLSGLFMIIEDQYGIGDIVDVGEATGVVESVSLRTTRLRDVMGVLWHVPNGEIRRVGNMSQEWSRALLDISVAYDSDIPKVKRILLDVAEEMAADPEWQPHFRDVPAVWGVQAFGPSEIVIRMVIKVAPAQQWAIERELRERIKTAFDAEGIEIPFPQRTLWIRDPEEEQGKPPAKKAAKRAAKKQSSKR